MRPIARSTSQAPGKPRSIKRRSVVLSVCVAAAIPRARADAPLTVFAAASLTDVMKDIDAAWRAAGHAPLRMSFASSSTLARQIEQGAGASVFASADTLWMDDLARKDLLAPDTRHDLLGNSLVLVMAADHVRKVDIAPGFDLAGLLGAGGRLAVGDPSNVPAGIYAKQALTKLGIWDSVAGRLAPSDSVRNALLLVQRGEAPAGIVYATDAAAAPDVAIAGTFPPGSHDPIIYPFAVTRSGDTAEARSLMAFLRSAATRALFQHRGFTGLPS